MRACWAVLAQAMEIVMDLVSLMEMHKQCVDAAQKYTVQAQQDDDDTSQAALLLKVEWLNKELDFADMLIDSTQE